MVIGLSNLELLAWKVRKTKLRISKKSKKNL